jgi:hypothetical protein
VFYFANLRGDATGDRAVTVADVGIVATNFGLADRTSDQGDFTADGAVSVADVGVLATNFGRTLDAPSFTGAGEIDAAADSSPPAGASVAPALWSQPPSPRITAPADPIGLRRRPRLRPHVGRP